MRFKALNCLMFLLVAVLAAATTTDVAGKWTAQTLMGPSGSESPLKTTFSFDVEGGELTGSVSSPRGTFEIQDGKVEGDSMVFNITVNGAKILYDGKITAEGIDFITKFEGRDRSDHFLAERLAE